jgi:hypothetical protein
MLTRNLRNEVDEMKNKDDEVTHNHKRAGAVIVLRSTAELAEVLVPSSGDRFWVKRADLTKLADGEDKRRLSGG